MSRAANGRQGVNQVTRNDLIITSIRLSGSPLTWVETCSIGPLRGDDIVLVVILAAKFELAQNT